MKIIGVENDLKVLNSFVRPFNEFSREKDMLKDKLQNSNLNYQKLIVTKDFEHLYLGLIDELGTGDGTDLLSYFIYLLASIEPKLATEFTDYIINITEYILLLKSLKISDLEIDFQKRHLSYVLRGSRATTVDLYVVDGVEISQMLLDKTILQVMRTCVIENLTIHVSDITDRHMSKQEIIEWLGEKELEVDNLNIVEK